MAIETTADAIPGATRLEVLGEMNEDWAYTLRVQRVLDEEGRAIYGAGSSSDPTVEAAIVEAELNYLDTLLDITGEDYIGRHVVERPEPARRT
jgi:hypothetical protein